MDLLNVIAIIFLCLFAKSTTAVMNYPIILVPGDGGSQMEAKLDKPSVVHYVCDKKTSDYFSLWLNMELLMPVVIDCFIDNMRLVYDNVTRTTSNVPGVSIRIPGFGNCSTVEWIDPSKAGAGGYFKDIGMMLLTLGYQGDISIRGAPYDFRKGPNELSEYFTNLKNLVEQTYAINGNKKVILLVHSLGGLMTLAMLHQQNQDWKDKYVRALITMAGVWGGAVKAVKVYAIGDDLGVYVLKGKTLRTEQISSPSLAWLLPSPYFWKEDEILVETTTKNYTLANLKDFFYDIDYPYGWDMYQDVQPFVKNIDPPGVEVYCLYGYGIPTVERLQYAEGKFPDKEPILSTGDGDGTVNRRSLQACTAWSQLQKQPVHEIPLKNLDHMEILKDVNGVSVVKDIISKL